MDVSSLVKHKAKQAAASLVLPLRRHHTDYIYKADGETAWGCLAIKEIF